MKGIDLTARFPRFSLAGNPASLIAVASMLALAAPLPATQDA